MHSSDFASKRVPAFLGDNKWLFCSPMLEKDPANFG